MYDGVAVGGASFLSEGASVLSCTAMTDCGGASSPMMGVMALADAIVANSSVSGGAGGG